MRIKNCNPGLDKIVLFIAISKVKEISSYDEFFVKTVKKIFLGHPSIELREIYFKDNTGRDFSSFQSLFEKVKITADPEDYILFQNRSGYGPFHENWYSQFVKQFEKFDSIALCGSTINFLDHPKRSLRNDLPHVQTYSFLTKVYFMDMLGKAFPASNETKKLDIVLNGEIEMSQFFLRNNIKITCMEWPDLAISNQTIPPISSDIKTKVKARHYFYHRMYFRKNKIKKLGQIFPGMVLWMNFVKQGL
ncbi:hypothetical protein [Aquiflexum gelatinilyticum]|uniref:hypothetical protein n=1 Tax=Aquiflexum gelatinilyticum TaxID=2961943 RepID=UPI002167BE16|nr:hypothetical protein [Aquiflexum gelatinilyticum]MCS4433481.1 hypothetical protein [Aquiflexum gelatinilyticum]